MTTPQDPNQNPPQGGQFPQGGQGFPPPAGEPQQPGYEQPGYQQPGQYPPPTGEPQQPGIPGMVGGDAVQKKSNTPRIIIGVVVVLAVVLGGILYFVNRQSDPAAASVGDCVRVNEASADDADLDRLDCTKPDALYKVTATGTSAICDSNENVYTEKDKDGGDIKTKLCLQPNVSDGECIEETDDNGNGMKKVDCAATKGDDDVLKVVKFDHTTDDPTVCPADSIPGATFKIHPGVICLAENK